MDESKLKLHLNELELSLRLVNRLESAGIVTVEDVLGLRPVQVLNIRQVGPKGLEQIYDALEKIGFKRR